MVYEKNSFSHLYSRSHGLAMDFTVKTLITGERVSQDDWTYRYFFDAIDDILWNELKDYFGGNITREQPYDHLRNRIGLYLNEQL